MLGPTRLRVVGQQCCVRLHGPLTLFRLGFFGSPWTGGCVKRPPLRFLKTIKDIDMKLTLLIKRREMNLLLLSYLSCDVT